MSSATQAADCRGYPCSKKCVGRLDWNFGGIRLYLKMRNQDIFIRFGLQVCCLLFRNNDMTIGVNLQEYQPTINW
jgi:hypothetical protein